MKKKKVTRLRLLIAAVMALFLSPREAFADLDGSQFHKSYNYQINLSGTNTVKLRFPCGGGGDHHEFSFKHKSVLNYTVQGQSSRQLMELHSKCGTKDDPKQEGKWMYFWFEFDWDCAYNHTLQLTSGSQTPVTFTKNGGADVAKAPNDDIFWIEMEFRVPMSWCGKRVQFEWDVWSTDNGSKRIPTDLVTLDISEAPEGLDPELTQSTIMPNDIGKIGYMWYISAQNVTNVFAQWKTSKDATGWSSQYLGQDMNGTVLLDATEPHYDFHIVADYTDSYGYNITGRSSEKVNMPILHAPLNLKALPANDGKGGVKVTWETNYPGYPDISETDFFEVQRSLTGREADFKTIASEMYDESMSEYEFYDENYLQEVESEEQLMTTRYRVRRSTTGLWGWEDNPTVATTVLVNPLMALYSPTGAVASWADEASHTMRLTWNYLPNIMSQAAQRTRPEYHGNGTAESPYSIASTEDWNQLADWIANDNAQYADKHYRLDADINVWRMIGDSEHEFKGTFDGNGNTINLAIQGDGNDNVAPFRYVSNATIKNLRVMGTVDALNQKFGATLIAVASGNTRIANCWSSATIKGNRFASDDRDATHGGLVGHNADNSTTTFDNCLFSGSIIDPTATNCAGFMGWSNGRVAINNCLMAGTMSLQSSDGSATFARLKSGSSSSINNSYYRPGHGIANGSGLQGTDASRMDNASLVSALGAGWQDTGEVRPVLATSYQLPQYYYLPGSGTESAPYLIESSDDWDNMAVMIETDNAEYADKYYRLNSDITVSRMMGFNVETAFKGTFDGGGHIIYLSLQSDGSDHVAPFRYVDRATISNLRIMGTVDAGQQRYGASLIGMGYDANIINCWSSATIYGDRYDEVDKKAFHGGFVGEIGGTHTQRMIDCRFDGIISDRNATYCGGFVGHATSGGYSTFENCLMAGSMRLASTDDSDNFITGIAQSDMGYYINLIGSSMQGRDASNMTADQLTAALGSAWTVWKGLVVPVAVASEPTGNVMFIWDDRATMTLRLKNYNRAGQLVETVDYPVSTSEVAERKKEVSLNRSCVNSEVELIVSRGTSPLIAMADTAYYEAEVPADRLYFQVSGQVSKTVMAETRQSSVVLTWDMDGDAVDYFQVKRKIKGQPDTAYKIVADTLMTMSWEDTTVSPLYTYIYKVYSAVDCEGLSFNNSDEVEGACKHTGKVEGRIQFPDGTGVAGITVNISSDDNSVSVQAVTDENGHFEADELSYLGRNSITYQVTPVSTSNLGLQVESYGVTFNAESNYTELKAFVVTSGQRFSGFVMYDGTSIPVKGAGFLLNGQPVMRGSKPLETDFEGKFSFYVISGTNTIQAVMDGHHFTDNGYFKSSNGYNFQGDVDDIYFYDDTKVKLIGRIVGGDTQGNLPLGHNLSHNNLGTGVKMVLSLEGDNTSWLVYDNLNPEKTTSDYTIAHEQDNSDHEYLTRVHTTRKRIEVWPDSKTGEYRLELPPVRWKVQQIYSDGYATLFQEGMVSEVIDLTDCLTEKRDTVIGRFTTQTGGTLEDPVVSYNAKYSRIYHNPVELTYKQQTYDSFSYLGDKYYKYKQVDGTSLKIPLAEEKEDGGVSYTFGYPVYSLYMQYPTKLSAVERYYWNNDQNSGIVDEVKVGGGQVTVQNDMLIKNNRQVVKLDENGEGTVIITVDELPYLLTGKDALRTITMTLTQDGTTYEAKPIQAYVLNIFRNGSAKDVISIDNPQCLDILRDPPGAYSSATLGRGSTLTTAFSMDMSLRVGSSLGMEVGKKLDNYFGVVSVASATEYGTLNMSKNIELFDFDIIYRMKNTMDVSYTATLKQDISTSAEPSMVGAPADLYIGTMGNMIVTPASTIRAIPDNVFQQMAARVGGTYSIAGMRLSGTLLEIAQGRAADGTLYHLVRDESLTAGNKVKSSFVYTQQHILNEIIPSLIEQSRSMMFIGSAEEAQAKANATGQLVYRSLVPADSPDFAVTNMKDGESVFNAYQPGKADDPDMSYVIHVPQGWNTENLRDSVAGNWSIVQSWVEMISTNEMQKQNVVDLAANYSLDGGGQVSYGEEFTSRMVMGMHSQLPFMIGAPKLNSKSLAILNVLGGFGPSLVKTLFQWINKKTSNKTNNDLNQNGTEIDFPGFHVKFNVSPVFDLDVTDWGKSETVVSRKESFNIKMNPMSHLDVDVYHVQPLTVIAMDMMKKLQEEKKKNGEEEEEKDVPDPDFRDMSSSLTYFGMTDMGKDALAMTNDVSSLLYPVSFVYRTRGGATAQPWEDERQALFYNSGNVLDARTKKIENPKIKLDKQSISGVSHSEPARFTVYLTNESEQPDAVTGPLQYGILYLKDGSNPYGAKVFADGQGLTESGITVKLLPGTVVQKVIEVVAGEDFDYEGLTLGVRPLGGYQGALADEVSFDVHFLRTAGNVDIASPADKWIMNTDAEYDNQRGYFIPVVISGFDKHQKNFDHIEFQYKESARGEDFWTNLCSYYADSTLMAKASGMKEMIPANGNITAHFYGEGVQMEKAYDLRAVLYCRNGNDFLTTSSKVMSGVKDTRRPQLFGTPEPVNGILGAGENIVFNFSEDIEYNYLSSITNFEVKGEVNNDAVTNDISLQFDGKGGVQSEAERNFADKDITIDLMIRPDDTGEEMPLFSHGSDGKKLQLWVTADNRLKAKVNDAEYISTSTFKAGEFTQVAMVISQPTAEGGSGQLQFFNGGVNIGTFQLKEAYTGTGVIIFGSTNEANPRSRSYYRGRMMEAKLWYRALNGGQIGTTYGNKRLTGYEKGLMDYWPMDEGHGDYVVDKAQGATLQIGSGVAWAKPNGMSLHLNRSDKGVALDQMAINRTSEQDYTLMFWFKTDADGTLISNGSGHAEDEGSENQFFIGFESDQLKYRTNGMEMLIPGQWTDGDWHHYAMTVNRAMNVLNIYIDQTLVASAEPETLGGISGGHPMLGSCVYDRVAGGYVKTFDAANYLEGSLDEICLFDQALPLTLIKSFSTRSPQGDEAGLLTYIGFQRQERSKDNDIVTQPYVYSKKVYKDENGEVIYEKDPLTQQPTTTPQRDYLFTDEPQTILGHIDQRGGAPVMPEQELHNLNFSFVGRDHSILVNINNSDEKINKRNIYVTMREIPDKNGNNMASAATACFFVDRNPLRWKQKTVQMEQAYGNETTFEVAIQNNSQVSHTFTVENYPRWLTVSPRTNTISPTEEQWITFTVNKDLNVGSFDEIIYLTDENGLSEPIVLSLKVNGNQPEWTNGVDRALRQHSMNITARVMLNNEIDVEPDDIVGVFDNNGVCHGVANISYSEDTGESFAFITVYDSLTTEHPLNFRLWNHSIGKEQTLTARDENNLRNDTIKFSPSKVVGSPAKPLLLVGGEEYIQTIALYKGWNWVSFNLLSDELSDFNTLLDRLPLHEGDIMTDNVSGAVLVYTNGHWMTSDSKQPTRINYKHAYFFKVQEDVNIQLSGSLIKQKADRTITVGDKWNSIGYTPMLNLTVQTALTDYNNKAKDGDVIKSHDEYAIYTVTNGVGQWKGSLKYMKPGEGYMLYRTDANETQFTYPFYEPTSTFLDEVVSTPVRTQSRATMSLTARARGIEPQAGDRLMAYAGSEPCGEVSADDEGIFYLSVAGDEDTPIWFALEREGDIIATTSEVMTYQANAIIGKPELPTAIDFTTVQAVADGWYTLTGIRLGSKPKQPGVYIHQGKKIMIK